MNYLWGIGGLLVGFVVGYIVNDKLNEKPREEVIFEAAEEKVARDAELHELKYREEEREKAKDIAHKYGYKAADEPEEEGPDDDDPVAEPEVISEEEYVTEHLEAETAKLVYYQKDDVLTDGDGDPIVDITDTVGEDGEWVLANTDDDKVYIYNDEYGVKYEVTVDHMSEYYDFERES